MTTRTPCPRYENWHCPANGHPCVQACRADANAIPLLSHLKRRHRSDQDQRGRMTTKDLEIIRPVMDAFERATPIDLEQARAMHGSAITPAIDSVWNEAIEAAAKLSDDYDGDGMNGGMDAHLGDAFQTRREIAEGIRKLKR